MMYSVYASINGNESISRKAYETDNLSDLYTFIEAHIFMLENKNSYYRIGLMSIDPQNVYPVKIESPNEVLIIENARSSAFRNALDIIRSWSTK